MHKQNASSSLTKYMKCDVIYLAHIFSNKCQETEFVLIL